MPMTYHCGSCNATWIEDVEPTDCPRCGSPTIERRGPAGPPAQNQFAPPMARVSTDGPVSSTSFSVTYWLGTAGTLVGYILLFAAAAQNNETLAIVSTLLIFPAICLLLAGQIISLVKLYRGWDLIQPLRQADWNEADMPSAGAAVGLLFVPFYNLYWIFVAIPGLAKRANKYMALAKISGRPMNEGLAQTYCILVLCTIIVCFFPLIAPVLQVIYYLFILDVDRMRNTIALAGSDVAKADLGDLPELA